MFCLQATDGQKRILACNLACASKLLRALLEGQALAGNTFLEVCAFFACQLISLPTPGSFDQALPCKQCMLLLMISACAAAVPVAVHTVTDETRRYPKTLNYKLEPRQAGVLGISGHGETESLVWNEDMDQATDSIPSAPCLALS